MDTIQKALLSTIKLTTDEKDSIPEGDYSVNAVIQVEGTFSKGAPTEKKPTCKLLSLDTLALVLHDCGVTGPAAQSALLKAFTLVLAGDSTAKAAIKAARKSLDLASVKDKFDTEVISKLPKTPVRGSIKGVASVSLVGIVETTNLETGEVLKRVVS